MARSVLLAVDCSTTAGKAIAFDLAGRTIAETRHYLRMSSPHQGWYEQDAEGWWEATANALADVASMLSPDDTVLALGLTNQRESFVCLDRRGVPLRPAILWLDGRAVDEIERLGTARVHELSGKPPSTAPSLYKIAWLARHEPQVLARTATVTDVQGFLAWRLTGARVTSRASADSTGLVDVAAGTWHDELVAAAGLRPKQLPALVGPGTRLGHLTPGAATRTGLPSGLPVIAGSGDGQASLLGTGAMGPGDAFLNAGTSLSLGVLTKHYTWGPGYRTFAGPVDGWFVPECLTASAGLSLSWFRDSLAPDQPSGRIEALAAQVPAVTHGLMFLPHLTGAESPHRDPTARGVLVGLGTTHGPAELYRALVEGLALEQRQAVGTLEAVTGTAVTTVATTGGLTQSPLVMRVLVDALQRPVRLARERESTALGAAIIAAASTDVAAFASVSEAVAAMSGTQDSVLPNPELAQRYAEAAAVFADLYPRVASLGPALARLRKAGPA
ncbi:FGGY-family carbohydrate kinase [Pedococcus sp. NPDC057267]|uniref:xylulokinase n=1 Tax=Pedococcus sp. NPDC057267 TaxID=3346077 RepID=UPI00363639CB